ncbi:MAG TPA: carboxypeptidase regulatory-like domain-containing protein [Thermoanaerobaculia bacterium]|nr:carboxypeptidase regulatory-like domain-containing protein [Thermoanaerobaculia bacterium]
MARRLVILSFVLVLFPLAVIAQTVTGTLEGTVTDKSGGGIPGVTVTIHNMETGLERVTTTNATGIYSAPFLPIGRYRITAELSGFGTQTVQNVGIELNTTTVKNFTMAPQLTETVTVSADAPHINVSDGEIKQTLTSKEIMDRPNLNPASFIALATIFAGFDENPTSGQDNPTASSGSSVNFNGAGTRGTTFQINGVNNDDSSENQHRQGVTLSTIKSFQIISNNYSAEFGRGYGAVVLVQTKSGTNNIDGDAYEYGQRSRWNSKSYSQRINNALKAPNTRDEYGATVGFPIVRDSLFAYASMDRIRNGGRRTFTRSVLTQADLALPRLTLGNDTPANRAFQNSIVGLFPKELTPNDVTNPRGIITVQPFDFPASDSTARMDWNAKVNQSLNARYQRTHQIFTNTDIIQGEQANQNNRQSNFGLTWTNILTANTVQEARYGLGLRSTHVLIAAGNDTPVVRFSGITNGPIIGNAGNFPIDRVQRDNQFVYNLSSVLWENHTLKAGTDIRLSELDDRADNFNRGFWTFGTLCNGVTYPTGIAAFMAGCVSTFQKAFGPNYLQNQIREENFYVQDDWHIFRNLTLNLGVRPEFVGAPKERHGLVDYQMSNRHYIDPRLGFAYVPSWGGENRLLDIITGGEGRMSIRGGFGIFHGRVFQSIFSQGGANVRFNPPNANFLTFTNSTNIADPTNGFVFTPGPAPTRVSITTINQHLQMPETHQWNLTFERQLFAQSRLRLSYVGTQARNLLQYIPWNLAQDPRLGPVVVPNHPFNGALAGQTLVLAADSMCAGTTAATVNAQCPVPVPIGPNEVSLRTLRSDQRRPDPRYSQNLEVTNRGKSWYHGGQIEWESGPIHGFLGRFNYTYSKTIDNGSEATFVGTGDINIFPITSGADEFSRGLSRFDTRHRFTFNGSYQLPFFANRHDFFSAVLGGWQLSTVIKYSSGTPFTVVDTAAFDIDFDGTSNQRPILVDRSMLHRHITRSGQLTPSMFRRAVYGDKLSDLAPRNAFYLDGTRNVDASLYKNINLPMSGSTVRLSLEVYNVFNHVQWGFPNNDIASATFGTLTAQANGPRIYQGSVRLIF